MFALRQGWWVNEEAEARVYKRLRQIFRGLERRDAMPGGAGRATLDEELAALVTELSAEVVPAPVEELDRPPPRAAAVAMAMALFSQPHFAATLSTDEASLSRAPDPPLVVPNEALEEALGLSQWELEDIREEVDRRVGDVLLQARALKWLTSHFDVDGGNHEGLFRVLFPGLNPEQLGQVELIRRGGRLYAVVDQSQLPPSTLFLNWAVPAETPGYSPTGTFDGRYVDVALRRSLARGIGVDEDKVAERLSHIVTIIPRRSRDAFLQHDGWRSSGFACVTQLGSSYTRSTWLTRELSPEMVDHSQWLRVHGDKVEVRRVRAVFSLFAQQRVNDMMKQLYGEMMAQIHHEVGRPTLRGEAHPHRMTDLVLYDFGRHLRAVLEPLTDWAASGETSKFLAERFSVEADVMKSTLTEVAAAWSRHLDKGWCGAPAAGRTQSARSVLSLHMIHTHGALRRLYHRMPDPRAEHRDILMLYAGHYLATSPAERLWDEDDPTLPPGGDPVGAWFWGSWLRILDASDIDNSTYSGPVEVTLPTF